MAGETQIRILFHPDELTIPRIPVIGMSFDVRRVAGGISEIEPKRISGCGVRQITGGSGESQRAAKTLRQPRG